MATQLTSVGMNDTQPLPILPDEVWTNVVLDLDDAERSSGFIESVSAYSD